MPFYKDGNTYSDWMAREGHPNYSEDFARRVFEWKLDTGDSMAQSIEYVGEQVRRETEPNTSEALESTKPEVDANWPFVKANTVSRGAW